MTNQQKYNLKALSSTKGLKPGDVLGDCCIFSTDSKYSPYNTYRYTILEIVDDNFIRVDDYSGTIDITALFLIKGAVQKEHNHPLTNIFSDNYTKKQQK